MTESIASPGSEREKEMISGRIYRGLDLYERFKNEISREGNVYRIPSSDGVNFYDVVLYETRETCPCKDFQTQGLGICKHSVAALLYRAKGRERVVEEVVHEYQSSNPFQVRSLGFDHGVWTHQLRTSETSPSGYVRVSTHATGKVSIRDVRRDDWMRGLPLHRLVQVQPATKPEGSAA